MRNNGTRGVVEIAIQHCMTDIALAVPLNLQIAQALCMQFFMKYIMRKQWSYNILSTLLGCPVHVSSCRCGGSDISGCLSPLVSQWDETSVIKACNM